MNTAPAAAPAIDCRAPRGLRTQRLSYTTKRCHGRVHLSDVVGRRAIFRTFEGVRLIGTVESEDTTSGVPYLRVRFADRRWARLDGVVTLVRDDAAANAR